MIYRKQYTWDERAAAWRPHLRPTFMGHVVHVILTVLGIAAAIGFWFWVKTITGA